MHIYKKSLSHKRPPVEQQSQPNADTVANNKIGDHLIEYIIAGHIHEWVHWPEAGGSDQVGDQDDWVHVVRVFVDDCRWGFTHEHAIQEQDYEWK